MKKSRFQGKVVLITGASSGIGEAMARQFHREGATLVLAARRAERLEGLAESFRQNGGRALAVTCDVTRDGDLEIAVAAALREFGRLDVVVANAGFGVVGKVKELKLEDFRRQFETNVFGVLRTALATLEALKKSKGVFAVTGSVAGYVALPGASAYSMSKFAVRALAEALRYEVKKTGVAVVLLSPGFIKSELRHVDNQGQYVEKAAEETRPSWLLMDTEPAARQMVDAIYARKSERVITLHGKIAVFMRQHFPWAMNAVIGMGLRGRKQPTTPG